jgi:hypothetical protein
MMMMILE